MGSFLAFFPFEYLMLWQRLGPKLCVTFYSQSPGDLQLYSSWEWPVANQFRRAAGAWFESYVGGGRRSACPLPTDIRNCCKSCKKSHVVWPLYKLLISKTLGINSAWMTGIALHWSSCGISFKVNWYIMITFSRWTWLCIRPASHEPYEYKYGDLCRFF